MSNTENNAASCNNMNPSSRDCLLMELPQTPYAKALKLQLELHRKVVSGEIPGALILLEHDPVITMGVKTVESNLLVNIESLADAGIELVEVDRGGDVTYHGPGQLVGYAIIDMRVVGKDLHAYIRNLEQSVIETLSHFGLKGERTGPTGVWVGKKKVCSIGIAVRRWVTYHGFALNVDPDMSHFTLINPCGLPAGIYTSVAELIGKTPDMFEVKNAYKTAFERVFGLKLISGDNPDEP